MVREQPRTVGILGIGRMGMPIARQLIAAGFAVVGYRRTPLDDLEALGGRAARTVADVAEAQVVISLLPDAESAFEAMTGLARSARPQTVVIDMATLRLTVKRPHAALLAESGIVMLDCPISGGPMLLPSRKNVVFGSGDIDAFEYCRPVFEAFSNHILHLGPFGAGSKLKFIAQQLVAVHNLAAAEAMRYAVHGGLDPAAVIAAIGPSIASSRFFEQRAPLMAERRFLPTAGPISMLAKDIAPVLDDADDVGVSMPLLALAHRYYAAAMDAGMGELDVAAMIDAFDLASVNAAVAVPPSASRVTATRRQDECLVP